MRCVYFLLLLMSPVALFAQDSIYEVKATGWGSVAAQTKKKEPPSTITFSASDIAGEAAPPRTSPATVCSFIKHQMATSIAQIPTLCSVLKTGVRSRYNLEVFSPTNVLEGRMRRGWSTALFQTAQALFIDGALNGICKASTGWMGCTLRVSDSYLSERHVHYTIDSFISTLGQQMEEGGPASDQWYLRWWEYAMGGESQDQLFQSKEPVEQIGRDACKAYLKAVGASPDFLPEELPLPTCSVLSATRSSLYVMIGLGNQSLPILPVNSPYVTVLPETVGRALYASGISGSVILKSSWTGEGDKAMRIYSMVDLNGIKLVWQEANSGVRDKVQALFLLTSVYMNSGQTDRKTLDVGKTIQTAAVVKLTAVPGTNADLLDLTDGSEWSLSSGTAQECLTPGTTVLVGKTRGAGKGNKTVGWLGAGARSAACQKLHAAFMGAW